MAETISTAVEKVYGGALTTETSLQGITNSTFDTDDLAKEGTVHTMVIDRDRRIARYYSAEWDQPGKPF